MSVNSKNQYKIKEEFPQILNNFTKAVIYHKPKDIIDFAITYFSALERKIPLENSLGSNDKINTSKLDDKNKNNEEKLKDENRKSIDSADSISHDSEIKVPISKVLEEVINKREAKDKDNKTSLDNNIKKNNNEISENDVEMKLIKDFIDDLFNE